MTTGEWRKNVFLCFLATVVILVESNVIGLVALGAFLYVSWFKDAEDYE